MQHQELHRQQSHQEETPQPHHQLHHRQPHQEQSQSPPPLIRVFKGGGYVAADLEFMLQKSGLAPALQLQHNLQVSEHEGLCACCG